MRSSTGFFPSSGNLAAEAPPPQPLVLDSNIPLTLAALLCALICVMGLVLVARCAWLRWLSGGSPPSPRNKGLGKKAIRALPRVSFRPGATDAGGRLAECPICLAEFVEGDEIRVLPRCGHGFHVVCVDLWLGSHSSCPYCRQFPVAGAGVAPGSWKCDPGDSPAPAEAARVGPALFDAASQAGKPVTATDSGRSCRTGPYRSSFTQISAV